MLTIIIFIFSPLVIFAIYFLLIYFLIYKRKNDIFNEEKISIKSILKSFEGEIIEEYIILDKRGKSHEIDYLFLSTKGIFVIEEKSYSGIIYGQIEDQYWDQFLYKKRNQIYNPIKQNETHEKQIKRIIDDEFDIYPIVVFTKTQNINIESDKIITLNKFKNYIASFKDLYDMEDIKNMKEIIEANRSSLTIKEHTESIVKAKENFKNGYCPLCGKKLIDFMSKKERIIRCSNNDCTFYKRYDFR